MRRRNVTRFSPATTVFLELFDLKPGRPGLPLLGDVAQSFSKLPWENLTKFIKKHRALEADLTAPSHRESALLSSQRLRRSQEVMLDHARMGTGGTCFSLTNALRRILTDLGFKTFPVMADMKHGDNTHCALLAVLDDRRFLLDPGYLVAEPVVLHTRRSTRLTGADAGLEYRPAGPGGAVELYTTNARGERSFRYRLRPAPVHDGVFMRHWTSSFDLPGMNSLHLNRISPAGRLSVHGFNLRIDTGRRKENVKLAGNYVELVEEHFGIDAGLVQRALAEWRRQRCHD
ncbi:MAG: hypothetical protein GF355_02560 [Candidatus Eisenbacteria bacterium]|nr:hypothetical protein [Candidatus Eisenbacteria bacterium]